MLWPSEARGVLVLLKLQVNSQKLGVQAPQNLEFEKAIAMLKCENLPRTNSTKSETQNILVKFQQNEHTPVWLLVTCERGPLRNIGGEEQNPTNQATLGSHQQQWRHDAAVSRTLLCNKHVSRLQKTFDDLNIVL